jgi:hypothetical protein
MRLRDAIIDKTSGWLACGPVVVAVLTGARLTVVERAFAAGGSDGVMTDAADLALALSQFGLSLTLGYVSDWGAEPPLWWCLRYCPDGPLIIAIEDRGGGHWIATYGWWLADVQTHGRWIEWTTGACTPTRESGWCGSGRGGDCTGAWMPT